MLFCDMFKPAREEPDGRWAWIVVIAASCIRIIVYGITYTSGVVYVVILEEFQRSRLETSWISSVITATTFFTCPVSGYLVSRFGIRKVASLGALVACSGLVISAFANSLPMLSLSYGVITGIGCGLTFIPGSVAVARYFNQRRNIALGVASAGGGVGTFLFPPIIKLLKDVFTWRGMFLIVAGIALNILVFSCLYRPVRCFWKQDIVTKKDNKNNDDKSVQRHLLCNWEFLRSFNFYLLAASNFLYAFGASIVFGHLSAFAQQDMFVSEKLSPFLYSFAGIAQTLSKIGQGFVINNPKHVVCQPYFIYIFSFTLSGMATLVLLIKAIAFPGLVVYSVVFGLTFAASGGSIIPAILIHNFGLEHLGLTYGIIIFFQAVGYLFGSPVAGWMCDVLRSYDPPFVLASIAMILSALVVIIPCRSYRDHVVALTEEAEVADRIADESLNKETLENDAAMHPSDPFLAAETSSLQSTKKTQDFLLPAKPLSSLREFAIRNNYSFSQNNININSPKLQRDNIVYFSKNSLHHYNKQGHGSSTQSVNGPNRNLRGLSLSIRSLHGSNRSFRAEDCEVMMADPSYVYQTFQG